jgi:hypothetical protein
MKTTKLLLTALLLLGFASCSSTSTAPDGNSSTAVATDASKNWDGILKKYVRGDHFAYGELKGNVADLAAFQAFLAWQGKADIKSFSKEDQIAFYINAYNSCCIKMVVDAYPVHSPKDIPGFFDKIKHPVAGESLTVSGVEYDRLIANYKDMRAHFAVVCSDRGCLPLKKGAYTGASLNADLEGAAAQFVKDERHFKVDSAKGEIQISKIFEWYGPKFTKDPVRPAAKPELFLLPWLSGEAKSLMSSGKYALKIIEWDWTLNETAKH